MMHVPFMRSAAFALLCLFGLTAVGCHKDDTPIRIGFIGGLTGGNTDLGQAGRNGAMLAVEEVNATGGVNGRTLELIIRDDANDSETAQAVARELIDAKVDAIIGPFTTAMSEAVLRVSEPAGMLLISPTASATVFEGKDDNFIRMSNTSAQNAGDYAEFMTNRRQYKRIAIAADLLNQTFAQTWIDGFKARIEPADASVVVEVWYDSGAREGFEKLIHRLLQPEPDAVLLVTNAIDAARITQQLRKKDHTTHVLAAEWGGTQQMIELGGKAVDGAEAMQMFNKFGQEKAYLRFAQSYQDRFGIAPNFSGIAAYEAITVLIGVLKKAKPGDDLKKSILSGGPYQGLQEIFDFDAFGDTRRQTHFVVVKGSEFAPAP